jgi:hypothetical protein
MAPLAAPIKCRRILFGVPCLLLSLAVGCTGQPTLQPVSGHVTLNNKPMSGGNVTFKPDKAKGNNFGGEPTAEIDASGDYTLTTRGKPGAPAGWYKVVVTAPPGDLTDPDKVKPNVLINPKYLDAAKTPLEKEVVATPQAGAYDLDVQP